MTRVIDPKGRASIFEYDTLNQVTAVFDAEGEKTSFSYDPNGNLLTVTYGYDLASRLTVVYSGPRKLDSKKPST